MPRNKSTLKCELILVCRRWVDQCVKEADKLRHKQVSAPAASWRSTYHFYVQGLVRGWQTGIRPEPLIKQGAQQLSGAEVRSVIVTLSMIVIHPH